VELPAHIGVRVRARGGGIEAQRMAGPLDLATHTGNITVGLAGPATVHAETGRGRIDQTMGLSTGQRGRATTADGRVAGGGWPVNLATGQGNIAVRGPGP
jgi:hypothetical protein